MIMEQLTHYLTSPEFSDFLRTRGVSLLLLTLAISVISVLFEIRLPLRYYWGLPEYSLKSLLQGLGLKKKDPVWGTCFIQGTHKPLPVVACELLDEHRHEPVMRTYTNHLGQFGFPLKPGRYLLRAVKARYRLPSVLDPENIEVYEVDESFVLPVIVLNEVTPPVVSLPLIPLKKRQDFNGRELTAHYLRSFLFQLGTVFLVFDIVLALVGYSTTHEAFYGLVIAVCVLFLFIKLYILETIQSVMKVSHA